MGEFYSGQDKPQTPPESLEALRPNAEKLDKHLVRVNNGCKDNSALTAAKKAASDQSGTTTQASATSDATATTKGNTPDLAQRAEADRVASDAKSAEIRRRFGIPQPQEMSAGKDQELRRKLKGG